MTIEKQTKQALDKIFNRVGQAIFFMAVSHLYDVGYQNMTDENVQATIEEIQKEAEPKNAIMTNDFKIHLLATSLEIRKVASPLELAQFISRA